METWHKEETRTDRRLAVRAPEHISRQMQRELFTSQWLHSSASCSSHVCFQKEATESHLSTLSLGIKLFTPPEGNNKSRPGIFFCPASIARRFLIQGPVHAGGWALIIRTLQQFTLQMRVWGLYSPCCIIYYWRQQITKLGIRRLGLCSCCVSVSYPTNLFFPICAMGTNIHLPNHWAGVITKWNDLRKYFAGCQRFLPYSFLSEYGAQGKALWVYLIFSIFVWVKQSGSNLNKFFQACIKFLFMFWVWVHWERGDMIINGDIIKWQHLFLKKRGLSMGRV